MKNGRSMMAADIIPVVSYPDVAAAADWLAAVFGFRKRLLVFDHRIQMAYGGGNFVLTDRPSPGPSGFTIMVRVADCRAVCEEARARGAVIEMEPTDFEYGECQCDLRDPWGIRWTPSQTIAGVDPVDWGGVPVA